MKRVLEKIEYKKKVKELQNKKEKTLEDRLNRKNDLVKKLDLKKRKIDTIQEEEEFDLDLENENTKDLSMEKYQSIIKDVLKMKKMKKGDSKEKLEKRTDSHQFYVYFGFVNLDEFGLKYEIAKIFVMNDHGNVEIDKFVKVDKKICGYRKINEREYTLSNKISKKEAIDILQKYKTLYGYQVNFLNLRNYKSLKNDMSLEEMSSLYFGYNLSQNALPLEKLKMVHLLHKFNKF